MLEVGLGGRWDATNVLPPGAAVVLTNVALEHTEFLGDTEAAIAGEKLAVCPDGSDRLVVGRLSPAARTAVDAELVRRGRPPAPRARPSRSRPPSPATRACPWRCAGGSSAGTWRSPSPGPSW